MIPAGAGLAMIEVKRAPHPATIAQRNSSSPRAALRPPHPATIQLRESIVRNSPQETKADSNCRAQLMTNCELSPVPAQFSHQIQRKTFLLTNSTVKPNDKIQDVEHARVLHNETQKKLAAYICGYNFDEVKNSICNHHYPYQGVVALVRQKILEMGTVGKALAWMKSLDLKKDEKLSSIADLGIKPTLTKPEYRFSLGAMPPVDQKGELAKDLSAGGCSAVGLSKEIDDLIFNLANDPRNLFYCEANMGDDSGRRLDWPDRTGSDRTSKVTLTARLKSYSDWLGGLLK